MKSFIAALRHLVLPFGQTAGRRIVLDGITGTIEVHGATGILARIDGDGFAFYDSAGRLFSRINDTGYHIYDIDGNEVQTLDTSGYELVNAVNQAMVALGFLDSRARLYLRPAEIAGRAITPGGVTAQTDALLNDHTFLIIEAPAVALHAHESYPTGLAGFMPGVRLSDYDPINGHLPQVQLHGARITINGRDAGQGATPWASATSLVESAAVTAETEVLRLDPPVQGFVWEPGRAYRIRLGDFTKVSVANNQALFQVRDTDIAGTSLHVCRVHVGLANAIWTARSDFIVRNTDTVQKTNPLLLTLATSGGVTARHTVAASGPRYIEAYDAGDADAYPDWPTLA